MEVNQMKEACAKAALQYIEDESIVGVGTGSTVDFFIAALASIKHRMVGAVASSIRTAEKLKSYGIVVYDLNTVDVVPIYVDGADEVNEYFQMIKGGGGAHTREKILAKVAKQFICIVDETKKVDLLGQNYPVAVEVIPMARSYVGRQLVKLGGQPVYREGFVTDNGNIILDTYGLDLSDPGKKEDEINLITGVIDNGLFARRKADKLLVATKLGTVDQKNNIY